MKKPVVLLVVIISVVALSLLGWWVYKSRSKPLTQEEITKSLTSGNPIIGDAGFSVPVKNISATKITARIRIVPTVEQNGINVKEGYLETTETWEPLEEKKIFIKYDVNRPMSGARYEVSHSFSVLVPK
jgi:hypothetical protein